MFNIAGRPDYNGGQLTVNVCSPQIMPSLHVQGSYVYLFKIH